jgi:hypothetical protein
MIIDVHNEHAACWCLLGAVARCYGSRVHRGYAIDALAAAIRMVDPSPNGCLEISGWQDAATWAEVKRVIELANV